MESHLLQMRGLKLPLKRDVTKRTSVASFTDAWIETAKELEESLIDLSHLLQMRGLKLRKETNPNNIKVSHLLQMRGLKPLLSTHRQHYQRRIFYRCVD